MSNNLLTDWNILPLILTAAEVGQILGLSKPIAYNLFHRADFPSIRISEKRLIVTKDAFRAWLDAQAANKTAAS